MSFLDKLQEGLSGVGDVVKGAAGDVWDAIQPAEAQAISPEEILKYNIKQAFNTSGRVLTPELTGQISQVAMPLLRKTPSYHQQRAQGSLFNSLLKTPNPETYNPEFISGHVKGMSRVPDWMFKSFPTDVNYKDPASFGEGTFGTYFHNPKNAAADVGINPAFPYAIPTAKRLAVSLSEADKVIPHELNHVAAYASKDAIKNSPIADAWDDIATVRGTGKILDNLNTKSKYYFNNFTNENITPYDIQPRELAAKYFASHLADGEKDIPGLFKASMKFATNAIKDAYPSISKLGEEQGDKIRSLSLPLLLAGGAGAGVLGSAEEGNTAPSSIQALSNFDRAEEAKSFFNPAGKMLSEVASLKGIGDVATEGSYQAVNPIREGIPFGDAAKKSEEERNAFLGNSKIDVKGAFDVSNERDQFTKGVVERVKNPIKTFEEQGGGIEKTLPAFLSTEGTTDYSDKFKKGLDVLSNVIGGVGRYGETQVNTLDDIRKRVIGGKGELGDIGKGAEAVTNLAEFTPGPVGLMAMGLNKLFNDKGLAKPEDYGDVSDSNFKSPHSFREDPNTYKDRAVLENVLLGGLTVGLGALALKSPLLQNEAGAINMQGFFSKLTTALDTMKAGKVPLSTKMTGKGLEQALKAGGISADELKFTGLGKELARIGDKTLGAAQLEDLSKRGEVFGKVDMKEMGSAKMKELAKQAEENALSFSKEVTPGIHSQYSLFKSGDPSFKNNVYKYPGTNFEEDHFGKDVVAHSRGGDKDVTLGSAPTDPKRIQLDDPIKSYHVDELQSQLHQRGVTFGYGELKRPSEFASGFSQARKDLDYLETGRKYPNVDSSTPRKELTTEQLQEFKTLYPDIGDAVLDYNVKSKELRSVDRSTPQGFAEFLTKDQELDKKFKSYTTNVKPVGDVPLQKDKWIELLAKDHLQEALKNGKDSISLTPAEEQFKRYYKDKAVEGSWEFNKDTKRLVITDKFGRTDEYQNARDFGLLGKETSKKIIGDLSAGKTAGVIEPEKNLDIYKGTYSEYERKMEGLTGGKFQDGWTKDGQGKDVKVRVLKLDEAKKKYVEESSTISLEDVRKKLSPEGIKEVGTNEKEIENYRIGLDEARHSTMLKQRTITYDANDVYLRLPPESSDKIDSFLGEIVEHNGPVRQRNLINKRLMQQDLSNDERLYLKYNADILKETIKRNAIKSDIDIMKEVGKQNNKVKPFPIAKAQEAIDFFNPTKQALA